MALFHQLDFKETSYLLGQICKTPYLLRVLVLVFLALGFISGTTMGHSWNQEYLPFNFPALRSELRSVQELMMSLLITMLHTLSLWLQHWEHQFQERKWRARGISIQLS